MFGVFTNALEARTIDRCRQALEAMALTGDARLLDAVEEVFAKVTQLDVVADILRLAMRRIQQLVAASQHVR